MFTGFINRHGRRKKKSDLIMNCKACSKLYPVRISGEGEEVAFLLIFVSL